MSQPETRGMILSKSGTRKMEEFVLQKAKVVGVNSGRVSKLKPKDSQDFGSNRQLTYK